MVGFYKTATGRPSITWPQAVDEALCFGWIDGMCKRIDDTAYEATFRANAEAWAFFAAQAPSYRKVATFWVMSAQREKTRQKRLATQIKDSAAGRHIRQVTYTPKTKG